MRHFILLGLFSLTLAGLASAAWAFDPPTSELGRFQEGLVDIKRGRLGPALGVDQRTVDQLLQIEQRYRPLRQQLIRDSKAEFQRLQQLMAQPTPSEQEVRTSLETINRKRLEMLNLQQRQDQEEMAILTPVQKARYIMFLRGFEQQIKKEARTLRGAPRGPAPLPTPGTTPREVVRPTP